MSSVIESGFAEGPNSVRILPTTSDDGKVSSFKTVVYVKYIPDNGMSMFIMMFS
jgi:hypothetical protein